jgi:tetratricopeptide (TPR) repeat protein
MYRGGKFNMKHAYKMLAVLICTVLVAGCSQKEPPIFRLIQLMQEGKYDEAIALGRKLTDENPDNTQAHRFLLRSAFEKNETEKYGKIYEDLARENPNVAGYQFGLGYIRTQQQDLDASLRHFQNAVELNPDIEYAHYMIGWVYHNPAYSEVDREKGLAEWEKEEQLNPRSLGALQVYANRAEYYLLAGDSDGAIKDYEKVAMYGFARDDIKDARDRITKIRALKDELARMEAEVRSAPDDSVLRFELGKVQYNNGMIDKAIETWTKAVELDPENAGIRNFLGKGLLENGQQDEAAEQLRRAIELDPTLSIAYFNLAVAEDMLGKTDEALELYTKYIDLVPMTPKLNLVRQRIKELKEKDGSGQEG